MYNKSSVGVLPEEDKKLNTFDRSNDEEYIKLKLEYERSKRVLEDCNVKSFVKDIVSITSKESASMEDYHNVFRLKRRLARTETFANQYYEWFKKNIELGLAIYRASLKSSGHYYSVITFGEGIQKGMFLDFEGTFLRVLKKSDYYNDYMYSVIEKADGVVKDVPLKDLVEVIKNFVEYENAEKDFKFTYEDQTIVYPLFEKVDCLMVDGDIYSCRLVLNEDIVDSLRDIIEKRVDIEANINQLNQLGDNIIANYKNVVSFNAKK